MNLNDYRLNAYKKASDIKKSEDISKDKIRTSSVAPEKKTPVKNSFKNSSDRQFTSDPELKAATEALTKGGLLKVPASPDGKEDVYRRVAKFLILIGVDQAALVLKHLSQEETEKIIPEITAVRKINPDEALSILEEFNSLIEKVKEGGGTHTAQIILEKAFGRQRAEDLMERLSIEEDEKPFAYLADKDSEQILQLLKEESNLVRSLVLSYIPPKKAADIINMLSPEDKKEVIVNLAKSKKVMPDVLKRVDKAMHEKSLSQIEVKTNVIDGKSVLAEILKKMDFKSEQEIISGIADSDPLLSDELQSRLFTIDDVLNSDDRFIQEYLRELDDVQIAFLIADKTENFRQKILSNMSSIRATAVCEEEQYRKPILKKDCTDITQKFFSHLRHAWESGKLIIKGRDEEEYV